MAKHKEALARAAKKRRNLPLIGSSARFVDDEDETMPRQDCYL